MTERFKRISKLMSLILRHKPEAAGLRLDEEGYVPVEALLRALENKGHALTRAGLDELVAANDKQRFAFDESGLRIRAVQGHSRRVDLGYAPATPPSMLFHGTVAKFLDAIKREGLTPQRRQFVHLSPDHDTAVVVGRRRGTPLVLEVDTGTMAAEGHIFYLATNGVWLTDAVPPGFIAFPE